MKRMKVLLLFIVAAMPVFCSSAFGSSTTTTDSLLFPKDSYSTETKTVTTSQGNKTVTYHLYKHIAYVANPVDTNYQSMNVNVPVNINGVDIDATNAPILFDIAVGGYLSASNADSSSTPGGGAPGGTPPSNGASGGGAPGGTPPGGNSNTVSNADLALAAGYVVVSPGCRGRDNVSSDGTYYGKAPAAIVDLKSAVRYIRHNKGIIPGNTDWIISTGSSAGGALSALLGASGDSRLYDAYFRELGAAKTDDRIFASACYCPITDLEHADMAYEWEFGTTPLSTGLVDQTLSQELKDAFEHYQASLHLMGKNHFGPILADNYHNYLLKTYLEPSATKYLSALPNTARASYLANNSWITWTNNTATFSFSDYVTHIGRMKSLPAFDTFDLSAAENILFGNATTNARHFTNFSLRYTSGDNSAEIDRDLKITRSLMNPMFFVDQNNRGCVNHWWIRHGTSDNNTSLTVITNLATSLENQRKHVNTLLYWDAGHGANEDPEDFITWISTITGYTK